MSLILSGTDGLSDVDGSAATPAIRGTDANTGIFFPAADTIAFSEGGAEIARFDSSGNLGVGTTSPVAKLQTNSTDGTIAIFRTTSGANNGRLNIDISDSAATAGFAVGGNSTFPAMTFANGGSERMRIDSSGNVGIGSTPTAIGSYKVLEVNGTSGAYIALKQGGTEYGNIYNNSTDGTTISASGARNIIFQTNGAERMRIDSSGNLQFNSGYGSVATAYGCRAWVNFNGTGTVAIRASGNVTSITDNGTGAYTVNFSTAMVDANYCTNVTGTHDSGTYVSFGVVANDTPPTTSAVRTDFLTGGGSLTDVSFAQVSIIR